MTETAYRRRAPRNQGLVYKNCRIGLYPDDWERLEKLADGKEWSRAYLASSLLLRYLRHIGEQRRNRAAEAFAADKARNGDDSWAIE